MTTQKKITRVKDNADSATTTSQVKKEFVPTSENKRKALNLRIYAGILWFLAIAAQVGVIVMIMQPPIKMAWVIALIIVDLAAAIGGGVLWKKSNRLDPASEKNKIKFFIQSQLGLVIAIIAFLPLIIVIFTNKNLDGKQKGILGGIAIAALAIAGLIGTDFNPPSVEKYTEEANRVEWLSGEDFVYWTKSGKKYHIYNDCKSINTSRTEEIFEGKVSDAHEISRIDGLCKFCETRAIKEHGLNESDYQSTGAEENIE